MATGIFVLTLANIFLTIRLFHSSQSPTIPVLSCVLPAPPPIPHNKQLSPNPDHQSISPTFPTVDCDYGGIYSNYTQRASRTVFSGLNLKLGRWDKTRTYKIHDNAFVGEEFSALSEKFSVCIATQSSLERLGSLVSDRRPLEIGDYRITNIDLCSRYDWPVTGPAAPFPWDYSQPLTRNSILSSYI